MRNKHYYSSACSQSNVYIQVNKYLVIQNSAKDKIKSFSSLVEV